MMEKCGFVKKMDPVLSPSLKLTTKYDYWFGSANTHTPLRYHMDTSRFLLVLPGQGIRIKMCPWQKIDHIKDYEHYEFWSKIDLWQNTKIKSLEFDVKPGFMVYIPSYWFYSIQYTNVETTEDVRISPVICFQYVTIMNIIANLHHYGMYFLQQQNVVNTKSRLLETPNMDTESKKIEETETEVEVKTETETEKEIVDTITMLQPKT